MSSLFSQGWHWTPDPPVATSHVMWLQACATMPSYKTLYGPYENIVCCVSVLGSWTGGEACSVHMQCTYAVQSVHTAWREPRVQGRCSMRPCCQDRPRFIACVGLHWCLVIVGSETTCCCQSFHQLLRVCWPLLGKLASHWCFMFESGSINFTLILMMPFCLLVFCGLFF